MPSTPLDVRRRLDTSQEFKKIRVGFQNDLRLLADIRKRLKEVQQKFLPWLPDDATSYHIAACVGETEVINALVKLGEPDLNRADADQQTALDRAVSVGDVDIVKCLLDHGAKSGPLQGPLHWASSSNKPEVMTVLLERGLDVEEVTPDGTTPLMCASFACSAPCAKLLIAAGAVVNRTDSWGRSAIHLTIQGARYQELEPSPVLGLLLQNKADPNAVAFEDLRTALHWACEYSGAETVNLLCRHKASVNPVDTEGFTPAMWAAHVGNYDVAYALIVNHNADLTKKDKMGRTIYHIAASSQQVQAGSEIIGLVRKEPNPPPVNETDVEGCTALSYAAAYGHTLAAKQLVGAGSDVNHIDNSKQSILHWSIEGCGAGLPEFLLENGAHPNPIDSGEMTPLDYAHTAGSDPKLIEKLHDKYYLRTMEGLHTMARLIQSLLRWRKRARRELARKVENQEHAPTPTARPRMKRSRTLTIDEQSRQLGKSPVSAQPRMQERRPSIALPAPPPGLLTAVPEDDDGAEGGDGTKTEGEAAKKDGANGDGEGNAKDVDGKGDGEAAKKKAEEEEAAKKKAEEEEAAKKKAEEEEAAKKKAEEEEAAKKKAEEEEAAKKKAEEEAAAKKAEEEEARRKAEEEAAAKKKAEEEEAAAKKKAEEEEAAAKKKAEKEAAAKKTEEEKKKAEEEDAAKKKAEEEEAAKEAAKKKAEEEAAAKKKAEEEKAAKEAAKKAEEEAAAKKNAEEVEEEEARRKAEEEAAAKKKAEEEAAAKKKAEEEEAAKKAEEEEAAAKKAEEDEARRKAEEEEARRKAEEEAAAKKAEEDEARRKAEEEEEARKKAEEEEAAAALRREDSTTSNGRRRRWRENEGHRDAVSPPRRSKNRRPLSGQGRSGAPSQQGDPARRTRGGDGEGSARSPVARKPRARPQSEYQRRTNPGREEPRSRTPDVNQRRQGRGRRGGADRDGEDGNSPRGRDGVYQDLESSSGEHEVLYRGSGDSAGEFDLSDSDDDYRDSRDDYPRSPPSQKSIEALQALQFAIRQNDMIRARTILAQIAQDGVDLDTPASDWNSQTVLHVAAIEGQKDMVKLLLERGANVDVLDVSGSTPLHYAAAEGDLPIVKLLTKFGRPYETSRQNQVELCTPLHIACRFGHAKVAAFLLKRGSRRGALDRMGRTPAEVAEAYGHSHVLKAIQLSDRSLSSLHAAIRNRNLPHALQILKKKRWLANSVDYFGLSSLHIAAKYDSPDGCRTLIRYGARLEERTGDNRQWTPLALAAAMGKVNVVEVLLKFQADFDVVDDEGRTPLMLACLRNHLKCAQLLLLHGCSVKIKDDTGFSAMHLCASVGSFDCMVLLTQYNASPNAPCADGRTPYQLASQGKHAECAMWLKEMHYQAAKMALSSRQAAEAARLAPLGGGTRLPSAKGARALPVLGPSGTAQGPNSSGYGNQPQRKPRPPQSARNPTRSGRMSRAGAPRRPQSAAADSRLDRLDRVYSQPSIGYSGRGSARGQARPERSQSALGGSMSSQQLRNNLRRVGSQAR